MLSPHVIKEWVLELGLYNTTLWAALAGCGVVAIKGRLPDGNSRLWKPLALLLLAGSFLNLLMGFGRAYVSPRDFLQDVVSAKEFLAGRSMYPDGMNDRFAELMAEERREREIYLGYELGRLRDKSQQDTIHEHWVQAHPPFMSVFFAGMVKPLGDIGTQVALFAITIGCLGWVCFILARELKPDWGKWKTLAIAAAACGAGPVVTTVRNGQADAILLSLIVLAWLALRRGRRDAAGVALGLAVSLKLIPALLLGVLLLRWPRAFFAAVLTVLTTLSVVVAGAGWEVLGEYQRTAQGVVAEYASYPSNLSILGFLTRGLHELGIATENARLLWLAIGGILGLNLCFACLKRTDDKTDADRLLALGTVLMPLLSPVAWDHYLTFLLFPLAIAAVRVRMAGVPFALMLLIWSIPETAYLTAMRECRAAGWNRFAVFAVEPLRTYALLVLASRLSRRV